MSRPDSVPDFESRPTVRLDQDMPEKGSIVGLSDSAFRLLIEAICYCGRLESDGRIPKPILRRMATKTTAVRDLENAGHIEEINATTWLLPDYLRWNRARSEINSIRESKSESGAKGAHMRWHVPYRKKAKDCAFCYPNEVAVA